MYILEEGGVSGCVLSFMLVIMVVPLCCQNAAFNVCWDEKRRSRNVEDIGRSDHVGWYCCMLLYGLKCVESANSTLSGEVVFNKGWRKEAVEESK